MRWAPFFLILSLALLASPVRAQNPPLTQCVSMAVAGGTSDAITIPQLPCTATSTLLVLTLTTTNTTTGPTIQQIGVSSPQIILNGVNGGALTVGALQTGGRALLTYNGVNWFLLSAIDVVSGVVVANNNTGMGQLPSTSGNAVTRLGFTSVGDAPSLQFIGSNSACTLNSGAGDGGTQVPGLNGNCWLAVVPSTGLDLREWGIKFDNSTDNSTALGKALAWGGAAGATVMCPDATSPAKFGIGQTANIANGVRFSLIGNGHDGCQLQYTGASGTALTFVSGAATTSAVLSGFTVTTNHAGGPTGISLTNTLLSTPSAFQPQITTVNDVVIRGADGYNQADYFTIGLQVNGWSYIDITGGGVFGQSSVGGLPVSSTYGYDLESPNGPGFVGVVYNFHHINVAYYDRAINQGQNIQGVTVDAGSNIDADNYGFYTGNFLGTGQVFIQNNQFNILKRAVFGQPATLKFDGNYVIMQLANNAAGLELDPGVAGCIITNNTFEELSTVNASGVIINDIAPTIPCQVTNNVFWLAGSGNLIANSYVIAIASDTSVFANNVYNTSGAGTMFPFNTSGMQYIAGEQPQAISTLAGCTTGVMQKVRTAIVTDNNSQTWGANIGGGGGGFWSRISCNGTAWTVMAK